MSEDCAAVDVVIVSHNGGTDLVRMIASVEASAGVHANVIVVDNASSDGSVDVTELSRVTVLRLPRNIGYGAAFNVGLEAAKAEWVVCANQDIEVASETLSTLVKAAEAHERWTGVQCIAGPQLLTSSGEAAESCHRIPTLSRQMLAFLVGERLARVRNTGSSGTDPQRCEWVSAAFILGRRSTFEAVSGFDPAYFMYVEDLEFFTRLARQGLHCIWVPQARVVHFGGKANAVRQDMHGQALLNWQRYFTAQQGPLAGRAIIICGVAGSLARAGIWWARSWGGKEVARARARGFLGGALVALRPREGFVGDAARSGGDLSLESRDAQRGF